MNIRKYTLILMTGLIISFIIGIVSFQQYFSIKANKDYELSDNHSRIVKTEGKEIKVFKEGAWESIKIKGVELSSFTPGYARFKSKIPKEEVSKWLEQIGDLNANVIKVPYIQPPSFYAALYDYNINREDPIYIMHEIMLDEKRVLENYDAFDGKVIKTLKKDIRKTINVIHGQSFLFSNKRNHTGLYLKDVSRYNLGFIIGTNTNPEIVTLTNVAHAGRDQYKGEFFSSMQANPYEIFVSQMLDYSASYESKKYSRTGILSFLTTIDTDALEYEYESNATKHAVINLNNISDESGKSLFTSYKFHPNSMDFLDYEYDVKDKTFEDNESNFSKQLNRLNTFYKLPVVISDTGISSSRGISKVDISDGYNRGGFSEKAQGETLVRLLKDIDRSGSSGAVINAWQDNWTNLTSFSMAEDFLDESASSYWHDRQSSDENFGLLEFVSGKEADKVYVDGDISDWEDRDYLTDENGLKLKVKSDAQNLYLLIEKEGWSLNKDDVYIGLDITPLSGSKVWKDQTELNTEADFIVKLDGYNESRVVVNKRYNIFDYFYKYYKNLIEKQDKPPQANSHDFSAIYLLNRKSFKKEGSSEIIPPIYYETGNLLHGNDNPKSKDFNSLADFNKTENFAEIKIPWTLLNMRNPLDKTVYGDFYIDGASTSIKIKDIGISINYKSDKEEFLTKEVRFDLENIKKIEYFERIKKSFFIVEEYWKENPKID